ncbi:MAG TPA: CBS domain-containing protein [bacterium]|nr:CBS domain-containing protein [bacterium]
MKKKVPAIREYMTPLPITIGSDQTIRFANIRMHEAGIRHLPVLDGGKLVGILSERDIAMIEGLHIPDVENLPVRDAMTEAPFECGADTPLDRVADEMASRKIGAAVIRDGEKVSGVFTTVDALRALKDALQS